jgi:hypothetical protein
MAIISARVVKRGSRVGEHNQYEAEFDGEIPSSDEVALVQMNMLYFHPAGYGMPFEINVSGNKVIWKSFANCD